MAEDVPVRFFAYRTLRRRFISPDDAQWCVYLPVLSRSCLSPGGSPVTTLGLAQSLRGHSASRPIREMKNGGLPQEREAAARLDPGKLGAGGTAASETPRSRSVSWAKRRAGPRAGTFDAPLPRGRHRYACTVPRPGAPQFEPSARRTHRPASGPPRRLRTPRDGRVGAPLSARGDLPRPQRTDARRHDDRRRGGAHVRRPRLLSRRHGRTGAGPSARGHDRRDREPERTQRAHDPARGSPRRAAARRDRTGRRAAPVRDSPGAIRGTVLRARRRRGGGLRRAARAPVPPRLPSQRRRCRRRRVRRARRPDRRISGYR